MNPLTNVKNINKINEREAELGIGGKSSWHQQYSDSAYIFIGGLPYDLTEGDILCVFSQYGEIVNINLVRDKKSGKSKGYCFIAYEDQRSTILAVDNLNGIKILGRTIRVDHVADYRKPKEDENDDDVTKTLRQEGCAPRTPSPSPPPSDDDEIAGSHNKKKDSNSKRSKKKSKKEKKKKKRKEKASSASSSSESDSEVRDKHKLKKERNISPERGHDDRRYNKNSDNSISRNGDKGNRYDTSVNKERDYEESRRDIRQDREDRYRQDRDRTDRNPHRGRDYEDNERHRDNRDRHRDYRDRSSDSRDRSNDSRGDRHRDRDRRDKR